MSDQPLSDALRRAVPVELGEAVEDAIEQLQKTFRWGSYEQHAVDINALIAAVRSASQSSSVDAVRGNQPSGRH